MRPTRKFLMWTAVVAVAAAATVLVVRPRPVEVDVARVVQGAVRSSVDGEARTRVRDRFVVTAPVSGRVLRFEVAVGDSVVRGQVIARIVPLALDAAEAAARRAAVATASAALQAAEARVVETQLSADLAARALTRTRALEDAGAIASARREELEREARVTSDAAAVALVHRDGSRASLRAATLALGGGPSRRVGEQELVVRAPAAGRVLRLAEESERTVAAGTLLLEVGDPCDLEVVVDVLSTDAVLVERGASVILTAWGGEGNLRGTVTQVEPAATTRLSALGVDEQRVNVVVALTKTPPALGDGFRLDASIATWEGAELVTVPPSALVRELDGWSVFVVRDGRAQRRHVQVGHRSSSAVELRGGVTVGEVVIQYPPDNVVEGTRVRAR